MSRVGDAQRRLLKRCYFEALRAARADGRSLRRHGAHGRLLVLNLHSVSPDSNPYNPSLHPDLFARLLGWLQPRAIVGLLREIPTRTEHDTGRPLVVLSFDDGLKDFVDHAMPVLASFGLRANQNVIGASLLTGAAPWAIEVMDLLGAAPPLEVQRLHVPGLGRSLSSDDPHAKERFGAALTNHLKALAPARRAPVLSALREAMADVVVDQPTRMMSLRDVADARATGHEIGSHSYSHESMEYLDDAQFLDDFRRSRDVLAQAGCADCDVFAFPNGSYRPAQPALLQREGVRHVLLVGERPSHPASVVHTRITLRGGSAAELRARAAQVRAVVR